MIIVDPRQRIAFTLPRFASMPEPTRPTLYTKPLTASEFSRVQDVIHQHDRSASIPERIAAAKEGLSIGLVGWDRFHLPSGEEAVFGTHSLDDVVSYVDLIDALVGMCDASDLAVNDRKKSSSPSATETGHSAESVDRAGGAANA